MGKGKSAGQKASLSNLTVYTYGMGEFGYNFVYTFFSYYVFVFLQQFTGVSPIVAATLYSSLAWIRFFALPISGGIVEAANIRTGKYRKLCLIGAIMMAVGIGLEFVALPVDPNIAAAIFIVVSIVGWVGYGIMYTAYRTLMVPMCSVPADAVAMSTASNQVGSVARIIYQPLALVFMGIAGGATMASGYTAGIFIFGIIMVLCMFIVGRVSKPFEDKMEGKVQGAPRQKLTFKDIKNTLSNRPMLVYVISMLFRGSVLTIVTTLLVIYLNVVVGAGQEVLVAYMMITYFVQFVGASVVRWAVNKWGRKELFIISTLLSVVFVAGIKFVGTNVVAIIILMSAFQFCGIFVNALIPVFMNDVGEYLEYTKGSSAKGFVQSIGGSALMLSAILGSMVGSFGLVAVGYNSAEALTPAVAEGITNLFAFGPSVMAIVSAAIFFAYPLTEKYMEKLRVEHSTASDMNTDEAEAAVDVALDDATDTTKDDPTPDAR